MFVYQSKEFELKGSSLNELVKHARKEYHIIQKRTPRRIPYVKSKYFLKDKVFISNFWEHLNQKPSRERMRRLKFYNCAIDLLRNTLIGPDSLYIEVDKNIALHRFYGESKDGRHYCVQVKENKRNNRKEFISVFPVKNQ